MHTLTIFTGRSIKCFLGMKVLLSVLFLFIQCSIGNDSNSRFSEKIATSKRQIVPNEILYKRSRSSEADEYTEGAYYLYNIKQGSSTLLFDGILMDYSEAWITTNNQYVIFTISSIILLNENQNLIERFDFKETEIVIGAQYSRNENKVYFLLKDTEQNKIELCQLRLESKELKRIIENTGIKHESIEAPFKSMFLTPNNKLFIEDYCYSFSVGSLKDSSITIINIDEGNCYDYYLGRNRNSIIYVKYTDASRTRYELKEYDFSTQESQLLLDGKNEYSKPVVVKLFTDSDKLPFLVQIDGKLFYYDYHTFGEIKIDASEILTYSENYLIYLDSLGRVKSKTNIASFLLQMRLK